MEAYGASGAGDAPGEFSSAALMQKGREKEKELKDRLREFFQEKAVPFDEAWRVEVKVRATGTSLGTSDAYYFSPANKRYRSRMEIARDFGLADPKEPRSGAKPRNRKSEGGGGGGAGAAAAVPTQPLSRGEAVAAAAARRQAFGLPHRLHCGVTVTNLGVIYPGARAFCTADRLWPAGFTAEWEDEKGVRFINSITETPTGPVFRIKAQRMPHDGKPATEIVELGAGSSPDAAYQDAEERQSEAAEIALLNRSIRQRGVHSHYADPGASPMAPAGRALDAAEHLLVKCRPLHLQWGLERFGLADVAVLQAIEGLPGVDQCMAYRFVDERPGGWVAEARRLNAELLAHGKQQLPLPMEARPTAGGGAEAPGSAHRKRGPRPSRKEAEENAVKRVLDGMVRQVEMDEVRAIGLEQKARAKAEKEAERLRKRADKEKMHDAMHKMREQQRLAQKAAFMEQQRRQAELNATVDDSELPNSSEPPPEPAYIATGRLPLHQQAVLVEAWQFVSRFGEPLLHLPPGTPLPTLQQLEAALLGEVPALVPTPSAEGCEGEAAADGSAEAAAAQQPPDAAVQLQMALVEFLVGKLFEGTAQAIIGANSDITMADLRGPGKHAHTLTVKKETWQEAARRYLTVLATSAMTQAKDTGIAGASLPLAVMDPWVILQYLTAGPPATLTQGAAALPRGVSKTAGHCVIARADATAVASAEQAFAAAACGAGSMAPPSADTVQSQQRLMRCLLKEIIQGSKLKKGDGRVLCYGGQAAAAAVKWGRPLDLRGVAARIDAGVYTALPDPIPAFSADVKYAASLLQAACNKQTSMFAQEYLDKAAPELAAMAVSKLESGLREIEVTGAADYLAHHAPLPGHRRQHTRPTPEPASQPQPGGEPSATTTRDPSLEPAETPGEAGEETPGGGARSDQQAAHQRQPTDSVRDLGRPFAPFKETGSWRGCVVCWNDDDLTRLQACNACDCLTHTYCLEPILEEPPLDTEPFLCPRCQTLQGPGAASGGKPMSLEFARASGGETAWHLAQLLASSEYSEWSVEDRCALLRLLCSLCAESVAVHDALHGDEEDVREKRKEIQSMHQEVKKLQAEMAAQQTAAQQAAQAAAGHPPRLAPGESGAAAAVSEPGAPAAAATALPPLPQQRSTRRARDYGAEVERMVEHISYLEDVISQVGPVRLEPVGLDRHYNRYWMLPAAAAAPDPANPPPVEAPPLLVIERHSLDSIMPASLAAAAAAVAGIQGGNEAGSGAAGEQQAQAAWQVGLYNSILHLQLLVQWLNPKGSRERPLAEAVTRLLDQHQQWAMQRAQPPRAPMEEDSPPVDPAVARAAAVTALRNALLSFEEGNQAGTYDELAGSEERRAHWRAWVTAASTPQTLMQALLVLEGMVRPEFLKQQWRPFAQPAPHPDDIRTLAAVWLRLEALKASVKLKVTINMRLAKEALGGGLLGSGGTRYSLREAKPVGKRSYYEGPSAHADSGSDSDGDLKETRAERAARRAAQPLADDEHIARELDGELNHNNRRTRQRQQPRGAWDEEAEWEDDAAEDQVDNGDDASVDVGMEEGGESD